MNIASHVRRLAAATSALAAAGLALAAAAGATPTVTVKARAVPIPGVPGTGNILGAGAAIQGEATISGTEYGGSPPPLIGIEVFTPAGTKVHPQGFATCAPSVLEKSGPEACPKRSIAGAKGFATGVVSFGGERVPETASVWCFFAPGGGLVAFIDGTSPALIEMLTTVHVTTAPPPFGLEFSGQVPLIETVPGALDASTVGGTLKFGAAYRQGNKTISYVTLPNSCPKGGWHGKVLLTFLGGTSSETSVQMPCPRK